MVVVVLMMMNGMGWGNDVCANGDFIGSIYDFSEVTFRGSCVACLQLFILCSYWL